MSEADFAVPSEVSTPALKKVYPALISHKNQYGNPNIPLGSQEGRMCDSIRRLHVQQKLSDFEVTLLTNLGFRFHTLEDVYKHSDFDEMFEKLVSYNDEHKNFDIPKKYRENPELGAWVTGVRRLGKEHINKDHASRLDGIQFNWISNRKCGSMFMKQYRDIAEKLENGITDVWSDPEVHKFLRAQREAYKKNTLSETRAEYMAKLTGNEKWWEVKE